MPAPNPLARYAAGSALLLALHGCSSGTVLRATPRMGQSDVLATTADLRLVMTTPMKLNPLDNRIVPTQVTCAEPSPDIAKVVADALGASSALAAAASGPSLPFSGKAELSGAFQRSYAEAVAQMTERMATMQLLRDGLYRACEAYANGAITDVTYGILVSRYDDTMVTMLLAELAAGNFGRSLAGASGNASGDASATASELEVAAQQVATAQAKAAEADRQLAVANAAAETPSTGDNAGEENAVKQENKTNAESSAATANAEKAEAEQNLKNQVAAIVHGQAGTATNPAGAISQQGNREEIAKILHDMQLTYLNDPNEDALVVSCIAALGATRHIDDSVKAACGKFLDRMLQQQAEQSEAHQTDARLRAEERHREQYQETTPY